MAEGSVTAVKLHPLVMLNVSDHFTRLAAQTGRSSEVIGAIFGVQTGRELEIMNSFELPCVVEGGACRIDREYMEQKAAQFKEVFKTLDLLGWYSTAAGLSPNHVALQKQMMAYTELPVLLLLNPAASAASSELPVAVYESVVEVTGQEQNLKFIPIAYDIASEEAERIGVEHVAQLQSGVSAASSEVASHLSGQYNAIAMLQARIARLHQYITDVADGKVPPHPATLRAVRSLLSRLPVVEAPGFDAETMRETNDVLLMAFLATLTKSCAAMNDAIDRVGVLRRKQVN